MILKASQRAGARQLARHLLRTDENDHVEVLSLRGFVSRDLLGALTEAGAIASGTRCKKFLFSLSLNPPPGSGATPDDLLAAIERAEQALDLAGQPRAIVLHEKHSRGLHAHAVWSRIDPVRLKAVPMPFFKTRLAAVSKDLFLHHGWDLPEGHRENGWKSPDNFTLAEWQQARRVGLDPRELKALFRDAWVRSDGLASFRQTLATRGYFIARGDRRGYVAVDVQGEVFSLARLLGIRTRDLEGRLGRPDGLPSVTQVKATLDHRMGGSVRKVIKEARRQDILELAPLRTDHRIRVKRQRRARIQLRRDNHAASSLPPDVWQGRRVRRRGKAPPSVPSRTCHTDRERSLPDTAPRALQIGAPSVFIRPQRPGEDFDAYMAYRRACGRLIQEQLDHRQATQRQIEELLAIQRARRMTLISHIAQLMVPHRGRPGRHP